MLDLVGQYLGRYHVRRALGEGGMAAVYEAYDTRLERSIAIKVIRPEKTSAPDFLARFEREAKALAQLSHPNIVKVLDSGEQNGMPYLVMEYIPGGTLKQRLAGAMPAPQAARWLAPVARALEYAHAHGIVHRDVKPANILIGEGDHPLLSDFGIARLLEASEGEALTAPGAGIGTPEYMAPEQGTGGKVDGRADVYALGVVFYELVTGRRPYQADTPLAVIYKHAHDPLPAPRQFAPGLPEAAERVLIKALAKRPEDRYPSMGDFAAALESLAAGQFARAEAATLDLAGAAPAPRPKSRRAVSVVLLAVVGLVVLCCLGMYLMYILNLCPPNGPWPLPPWCGVKIPADYNRLICPPPGNWPLPPWC